MNSAIKRLDIGVAKEFFDKTSVRVIEKLHNRIIYRYRGSLFGTTLYATDLGNKGVYLSSTQHEAQVLNPDLPNYGLNARQNSDI